MTSITKLVSNTKISFFDSIEIDDKITPINAELSMTGTFQGITIECSDEDENAYDLIRVKCQFDSNLVDESDSQNEKLFDPTISIFRPMSIDDDFQKFRINL
jgi:hypothetical protein